MNIKNKKFLLFVLIFCLIGAVAFPKSKIDLKRQLLGFKLGVGFGVDTPNLMGLIETCKMSESIDNGTLYDYPGLTEQQKTAFKNLDKGMQRAVLVANVLSGFEYKLKMRMTYHVLLVDTDLSLLPFDGSYNGRLDLALSFHAGIRAPFFIQPYITAGVNFNFSFYPDDFKDVEKWKSNYAGFGNFVFRPGLVCRLGLDLNFNVFSIGVHYQYSIKDFDEFSGFYNDLIKSNSAAEAAGKIFAYQSRVGIDLIFHVIK